MRRKRFKKMGEQSINRLIPNILTVLALCSGLTSIRLAYHDKWELAVIAIFVAAFFDGIDGRIARLLHGTSRFGAELDSLSDFACFGIAPAFLLYHWTLQEFGGLGWVIALLYAVCCALRLARFNTKLDNADLPAWTSRFFTGVPSPSGAILVLIPLIASFEFGPVVFAHPLFVGVITMGVAALMVSRIPTYSFKTIRVAQHLVLPILLAAGVVAAFLVSTTWNAILFLAIAYLASIPFSYRAWHRLQNASPLSPSDTDEDTFHAAEKEEDGNKTLL